MAKSAREELGQIVIRPTQGMRDRIRAAAEANNRSMNAEIVATLNEKYPPPIEDAHGHYAEHLASWTDRINAEFPENVKQADLMLKAANEWLDTIPGGKALRFAWVYVKDSDDPVAVVMKGPTGRK